MRWQVNSPPRQLACFAPTNIEFRHLVWHDLLQKNLLLFEFFKARCLFHVSFPQVSQITNLPVLWLCQRHFIEQYLP